MGKLGGYEEQRVAIGTRVPYSIKQSLLQKASDLGITISEVVYNIIVSSDNNFGNEQLTSLKNENSELKKQLNEMEKERDELKNILQTVEEKSEGSLEDLKETLGAVELEKISLTNYVENLQLAYCQLKAFTFKIFAEKHYLKDLDQQNADWHNKEFLPNLEQQAKEALKKIIETFKESNSSKLSKEQLFEKLQGVFFENFKPETFGESNPSEQKAYYMLKEHVILSELLPILEKIDANVTDYDWSDLENICDLDIEQDYETILEGETEMLENKIQEKKLQIQASKKESDKTDDPGTTKLVPQNQPEEKFSSKEEKILSDLFKQNKLQVSIEELRNLGFNTGFWGKLTARGAKYGKYQLKKAPSEKLFVLSKI